MLREYQMGYSFDVRTRVLQAFKQIKVEESGILLSSKNVLNPETPHSVVRDTLCR